jgi:hypothetical protein
MTTPTLSPAPLRLPQLLLANPRVRAQAKANRLLEYLEDTLARVWLKARHLALIAKVLITTPEPFFPFF